MKRWIACVAAFGLAAAAVPSAALADVPVHLRVLKGSKKGPAKLPPSLEPLKRQLSSLAYHRGGQASDEQRARPKGKGE